MQRKVTSNPRTPLITKPQRVELKLSDEIRLPSNPDHERNINLSILRGNELKTACSEHIVSPSQIAEISPHFIGEDLANNLASEVWQKTIAQALVATSKGKIKYSYQLTEQINQQIRGTLSCGISVWAFECALQHIVNDKKYLESENKKPKIELELYHTSGNPASGSPNNIAEIYDTRVNILRHRLAEKIVSPQAIASSCILIDNDLANEMAENVWVNALWSRSEFKDENVLDVINGTNCQGPLLNTISAYLGINLREEIRQKLGTKKRY